MAESYGAGNRPDPELLLTKEAFGKALTELRRSVGLSLSDAVKAVNGTPVPGATDKTLSISKSSISAWCNGTLPQNGQRLTFGQLLRVIGLNEVEIDQWWGARCRIRVKPAETRPGDIQPYRGLSSFAAADADWYFGRSALMTELLGRIGALHAGGGGLIILVGASGSGKSSLLLAGLTPALERGELPGSAGWPTLVITPGRDSHIEIGRFLSSAERGIDSRDGHSSGGPLIIFDQFEQVFTGDADEDRLVAAVSSASRNGASVVLSLRADFYGRALRHESLRAALDSAQVTVGPMTADEIREVIEKPAERAGIDVERELVEILVREVVPGRGTTVHETGALPLLSYALHEMWVKDRAGLTITNYEQVGGIDGAVAASAEAVYAGLSPHQQRQAQRLFLRLIRLHPDMPDTRRRVRLGDLLAGRNQDSDREEVLKSFIAQRLITVDVDTVEITHEALIGAWPRLREWLEVDRGMLLLGQQVDADALEWQESGRESGLLYRGTRLVAAREWADLHGEDVPAVSRHFLATSRRRARRRARLFVLTMAVLAVLLFLTGTLAAVVFHQRNDARDQRNEARTDRDLALSRMTAVRADQLRSRDVSLARQLSLAAYRIAPTTEARSSLLDASALRPAVRIPGGTGILYATAVHPDGHLVATGSDTDVKLWDVSDQGRARQLYRMPTGALGTVYAVAFDPAGGLLVASTAGATVLIWDIRDPAKPRPLESLAGLGGSVYSVAFSPDGRMVGAACDHGIVRLWRVGPDGTFDPMGKPIRVEGKRAKSLSIRAGNGYLAVGDSDGTVGIWDIGNPSRPELIARPIGPEKEIGQLAFSPDGRWLAAGGADRSAYIWNVTTPRAPQAIGSPITGATSWINAVAFSPDSASVAIASSDGAVGVRVIDVATRAVVATLPHPVPVTSVRFTSDGTTVVTGSNDGMARLWSVPGPALAMPGPVSSAVFDPTGRMLAVGSSDTRLYDLTEARHPRPSGRALTNKDGFASSVAFTSDHRTMATAFGRSGALRLWNVTDPARPAPSGQVLTAHPDQQIEFLTFGPDGRTLATASRDGTVRLWDVRDSAKPRLDATLSGFSDGVYSVAFSPDGKLLAAASADKTVRVWNVADPTRPRPEGPPLKPGDHYAYSVAFSPDGTTLAVSLADGKLRLYGLGDPAAPELVAPPLAGPTGFLYTVNFSSDGTLVAGAGTDGTLWLWDVSRRNRPTLYAKLTASTGILFTVGFRPGTDMLAAGGADGGVSLWHTDPERAAALICATSGEPITRAEWGMYVPGRAYQPPCV
ncbi:hypothetical protein [Cryptosporangium sp. NPDC048952]|uniref:nSTAND1 domain-containing NTPase n=1 Tax=Cryptosporangium sp. NPDC048952 TaxID=3363961 RepID=UPI003715F526